MKSSMTETDMEFKRKIRADRDDHRHHGFLTEISVMDGERRKRGRQADALKEAN